jgi:hypothetical protein
VHEGIEVIKTGRLAERKLRSGKIDQLIEVTPKDTMVGSFKKWIHEEELFEVLHTNEET